METKIKKFANFMRNVVLFTDYYIHQLFRLFYGRRKIPYKRVKRILVVELLYIGDLIAITPTLRALKKRFPHAEITLMTLPKMKDVVSGNPNVDKIISYSKRDIRENFRRVVNELRWKYDLAVILHPGSVRISWLLLRADIPYRVGCTRVGFLEGKGYFLTHKVKPSWELKHKIDDDLDVVKTIYAETEDKHLEIYTTKEAEEYVGRKLKENKVENKDYLICIQASPQHKSHEWIDDRFAEVADRLIDKNKKVIFVGAKKDREKTEEIISLMKNKEKAINFCGETDIKQFFALVKRSDLVISVDSAAMHVAAAFNKKVIALFGAGNPRIWRPYCSRAEIIFKEDKVCTSCMKHTCSKGYNCMEAITIDDVMESVERLK